MGACVYPFAVFKLKGGEANNAFTKDNSCSDLHWFKNHKSDFE